MNDLIRPAMYGAWHDIVPVVEPAPGVEQRPTTSSARSARPAIPSPSNARCRPLAAGDLVAFRSAGAYGAVMASEYNTRPLIPEVLVKGDQFAVIRARPTFDEIINRDTVPEWV
jgi:diaminopimelate decarboxylase